MPVHRELRATERFHLCAPRTVMAQDLTRGLSQRRADSGRELPQLTLDCLFGAQPARQEQVAPQALLRVGETVNDGERYARLL